MKFKLYPPQAIYELGKRDNQEDAIFPKIGETTDNDRLFILCDGMGGHEKGEVASNTISQAMAEYLDKNASADAIVSDDVLLAALEYAYQQLDTKDDGAARKMGSTLCLLLFHHGGATAMHIGDSRIYHIRPSEHCIVYQSKDHSLVYDLYQAGEISYDEMRTSPQKNIITRAIQPGEDNRTRPSIVHIADIKPGDYFFICSDGMLEQMENDELCNLLSSNITDEEKRTYLEDKTKGNKDNHSSYIIHIDKVIKEQGDEQLINDELTSTDNAMTIKPSLNDDVVVVDVQKQQENVKQAKCGIRNKQKAIYSAITILAIAIVVLLVLFAFNSCQLKSKHDLAESVKAFNSELPLSLSNGMLTITSCTYDQDVVELKYSVDENTVNISMLRRKIDQWRENARITLSSMMGSNTSFSALVNQMLEAGASFNIVFVGRQSHESAEIALSNSDLLWIKNNSGNNGPEELLKATISSTNLQLPLRLDEITTLTSVTLNGGEVIINYVIDESNDFSVDDMAPGTLTYNYQKQELMKGLNDRNTPDGRLASLCIKCNKYLVFHYNGGTTGQVVGIKFSPSELSQGKAETSLPSSDDYYNEEVYTDSF